jgi:hypothetical protein
MEEESTPPCADLNGDIRVTLMEGILPRGVVVFTKNRACVSRGFEKKTLGCLAHGCMSVQNPQGHRTRSNSAIRQQIDPTTARLLVSTQAQKYWAHLLRKAIKLAIKYRNN